jgi:hypothetical protein
METTVGRETMLENETTAGSEGSESESSESTRSLLPASWELEARSTGSHSGGQTMGWSTSANLLAAQGLAVFEMKAAQKVAATPMRTSARELEACFFAYRLRSGCMAEVNGVAGFSTGGRGACGLCAWVVHGWFMGG